MNLESLKETWNALDRKIQTSQAFNEKLMEKIFSSRVGTNLDSIRKQYFSFYFVLTVECIVLTAILLGNPFDFTYWQQFIPFALLLVFVATAFLNLAFLHHRILSLSSDGRIVDYLKEVISIYDKNKTFERVFAVSILAVGSSVPFAFLPNRIVSSGSVLRALIDTAMPIVISIVMFIVAGKLGLFRNKHKEKFTNDLNEWQELRMLTDTLTNEG